MTANSLYIEGLGAVSVESESEVFDWMWPDDTTSTACKNRPQDPEFHLFVENVPNSFQIHRGTDA